jgi:hypothetical protein
VVSTRVVVSIGAFVVFLGIGSTWIAFTQAPEGFNLLGLLSAVGSFYGPCACPPDNTTIQGQFLLLFVPKLVALGPLVLSILIFPIGLVLGFMAIFRWRLAMWAGGASVATAALWIWGTYDISGYLSQGLGRWPGYRGKTVTSSVWPQLGPFQVAAGGAILLAAYFLSRVDKLGWPIDES